MTIIVSSTNVAGMTFLQLVQKLRRKCRTSGANPSTLQNVTVEEVNRLIDWINEAWLDIQSTREDWKWMRKSAPFPTATNQAIYALTDIGITDFANWDLKTFRNYVTATGLNSEITMDWLPYDEWRDTYLIGANRNAQTRPVEFSISPQMGVCLGPVPLVGYTITGDYFSVPTPMVYDSDMPSMPVQYHWAIVYRAMMYYGASEAAQEVYDEGQVAFTKYMNRLAINQLTTMQVGGALA